MSVLQEVIGHYTSCRKTSFHAKFQAQCLHGLPVLTYSINEKKCNNFPFHYFPFPVHSYFTTEYAYAYSTQLSTVFQLCAFQAGIRMYILITIPGVWNGKLLFHSFQARVDFQWCVELEMESLLSIPYFQCGIPGECCISFRLYRRYSLHYNVLS